MINENARGVIKNDTSGILVVDSDSKWTSVVEGMTAYSPEDLRKLLDEAGFTQTEIHRKKPTYATIIGVKA